MYAYTEFVFNKTECVIFYNTLKLTAQKAIDEFNLAVSGQGCNQELINHYIVVPKSKMPIIACICETEYKRGYDARMIAEEYIYED
jgi:hypothetical protein